MFKKFSFPRVFAKSVSIGVIKRMATLDINENVNRQFCVRYMSVSTTKFFSLSYNSNTASPNHVSVVCTRRKWRPCKMELINGKYFIAVIIRRHSSCLIKHCKGSFSLAYAQLENILNPSWTCRYQFIPLKYFCKHGQVTIRQAMSKRL